MHFAAQIPKRLYPLHTVLSLPLKEHGRHACSTSCYYLLSYTDTTDQYLRCYFISLFTMHNNLMSFDFISGSKVCEGGQVYEIIQHQLTLRILGKPAHTNSSRSLTSMLSMEYYQCLMEIHLTKVGETLL